jgi:hypothetical protein
MIDVKSRLSSVAGKEKWVARGASFVTKAKATKVVWFPPKPVEAGKAAVSTATEGLTRTGSAAKETAAGAGGVVKKRTAQAGAEGAVRKRTAQAGAEGAVRKRTPQADRPARPTAGVAGTAGTSATKAARTTKVAKAAGPAKPDRHPGA